MPRTGKDECVGPGGCSAGPPEATRLLAREGEPAFGVGRVPGQWLEKGSGRGKRQARIPGVRTPPRPSRS